MTNGEIMIDSDISREYYQQAQGIVWEKSSDQAQHEKMESLLEWLKTQDKKAIIGGYESHLGYPPICFDVQDRIWVVEDRVDRYHRKEMLK